MNNTLKHEERIALADTDGTYKTLLESTKAIPWKINWETMKFSYIGPQIEALLGWPQESWLTANDWIERIHPDDRERTTNFCVSQSIGGVDHEADYRALTADGNFVWIRDVVHVIRKNGVTTELVGFMFDISERKKMEEELLALNRKLEVLTLQDGLTCVANRRLFDQTLKAEWFRSMRDSQPLSLIVFDIDHFKQYNDFYGHLMGDECLIRVAQALNKIPLRTTDLFARYGGEEFVLLLPKANIESAVEIAEKCRCLVQDLAIPHEKSSTSNVLTISVGVASITPSADSEPASLFAVTDRMLYQAKEYGRNRVVS
ncbi:sensor domain-containing diguanylate cyclase [Ferrovum sp.]|jgi:diguanylate cyclase (GGDEF)-like protein/PAS domain S-box-containing protein|uniref:sensor domain-containing diguanylate cyclase n=1 Tax=Ferrovum sp. TaxID=2609467 RepID=UPI0026030ECB|nr:sensor domain-containing diguanylate cyclase [Ferrovum sp.]